MSGRWLDPLRGEVDSSAGGRFFLVTSDLRFEDAHGDVWTVRAGFRCDLASIPRLLKVIAPAWQQSAKSGCGHDAAYFEEWGTRARCDALFHEMLLAEGVDTAMAYVMWAAVRVGGWRAWRSYRKHGARRGEWMTSPRTFLGDGGADF